MQRFGRGPGYPLFLAPLTWLDADLRAGRLPAGVPAAVKIVQAILGAAAILVLAALVRRVAGDRAGAAAAWIAALFPPLVWMPAYALSEQLASVLALGCAAWLGAVTDGTPAARGARSGTTRALVAAGLAAGVGALTRPGQLFFLPLAALLLFWRAPDGRTGVRRALLFTVLALAAIAPWTVRNAIVHRQFVPIASSGGVNFWIGNHREAIGDGDLAANPPPQAPQRRVPGPARRTVGGGARAALLPRGARLHRRRSGVVARTRGSKALVHLRAVRARRTGCTRRAISGRRRCRCCCSSRRPRTDSPGRPRERARPLS